MGPSQADVEAIKVHFVTVLCFCFWSVFNIGGGCVNDARTSTVKNGETLLC